MKPTTFEELHAVTLWWAFTQDPPNQILVLANDRDQAEARVFKTIVGLLKRNPERKKSAKIQKGKILLSNGTEIVALASEYAGAAWSYHGLTSWDECGELHEDGADHLRPGQGPEPRRVPSRGPPRARAQHGRGGVARGWRIAKDKAAKKIDGGVALSDEGLLRTKEPRDRPGRAPPGHNALWTGRGLLRSAEARTDRPGPADQA